MEHGIRQHARYGASSAHRWLNCPGCLKLADTVPSPPPSDWALDGTEAHELMEYAFLNGIRDAVMAYYMTPKEWTHRKDNKDDRCESVQVALDYVYDLLDAYDPHVTVYFEVRFHFPSPYTDDAGGTSDICLYIPELGILYVIDFKHGSGHAVDAVHNWQLLMYMVGATTQLASEGKAINTTVGAIIQPRAFHPLGPVREWIPTDREMADGQEALNAGILRCEQPNAPRIPGDWCQWCPAASVCPDVERRIESVLPTFNVVGGPITLPEPKDIPVDRLAAILATRELVEGWYEDVASQAYARAMAGHMIPGFKLVYTMARRRWEGNPDDVARKLMELTGTTNWDDVYPRKLIGITDAEAKIVANYKAGLPKGSAKKAAAKAKDAMAPLTTKDTSGNLTLVDERDKRTAVNPATALFGQVNIPPLPKGDS